MDKIYSRRRIKIPNIRKKIENKKMKKIIILFTILIIGIITAKLILSAIIPIIDKECRAICKTMATKVSNEQATKVMNNYKYDDMTVITKDSKGNIAMISANMITVNEITSDIAIKIQEAFEKNENAVFNIKLGSFLGSKMLSGRGPDIEIKLKTTGNIETNLISQLESTGINQTLHKIYLEVKCKVSVLTPFETIEEQIVNQILLAESVIIGTTPNTYYNLEGLDQKESLEAME